MQLVDVLFIVAFVLFSSIVHEVMHGVVAEKLGDPTARYAGRLTLNPLVHIDPFGSIILPILTWLTLGVGFGYAKPVPYNPYNLKPGRWSEALVAGAGPASNFALALFGGLVLRSGLLAGAADIVFFFVVINVALGMLNLVPVPPIDGSKVLEALLPRSLQHGYGQWRHRMEANPFLGMAVILIIVLLLGGAWSTLILSVASAVAGL